MKKGHLAGLPRSPIVLTGHDHDHDDHNDDDDYHDEHGDHDDDDHGDHDDQQDAYEEGPPSRAPQVTHCPDRTEMSPPPRVDALHYVAM